MAIYAVAPQTWRWEMRIWETQDQKVLPLNKPFMGDSKKIGDSGGADSTFARGGSRAAVVCAWLVPLTSI